MDKCDLEALGVLEVEAGPFKETAWPTKELPPVTIVTEEGKKSGQTMF